jgi:hypothetical protein
MIRSSVKTQRSTPIVRDGFGGADLGAVGKGHRVWSVHTATLQREKRAGWLGKCVTHRAGRRWDGSKVSQT